MADNSIPPDSTDRTDALPAVAEGQPIEGNPGFVFQAQPHGVSGSTADLYGALRDDLDQARQIIESEPPPYVAGTIDVSAFLKALARFNLEQAFFLRNARKDDKEDYLQKLTQYSLAQDDYIQAMSTVLHELGVI